MSEIRPASSSGTAPAPGPGGADARRGSDPSAMEARAADVVDIPAVVAIVVALNPGEEFVETLASLGNQDYENLSVCLLYTSPSPRDKRQSRMPSSA